jgi:CDP-4-dehydro-6-deoxyglucose reductase
VTAAGANACVRFRGRELRLARGETVLECFERHGIALASSCRSGVCQSCLVKATDGPVPPAAQVGLKPAWQRQGYLLACLCRPEASLTVEGLDAADTFETRVLRAAPLAPGVAGVWLEMPAGFSYLPGQFVHVIRPEDGLVRPYSIASTPEDGVLELHVAVRENGRMSQWLPSAVGARVQIRGPLGECTYPEGAPARPMLLAATGTGLGPLLGVVRCALAAGHHGPIRLYHAARTPTGLYAANALRALARRTPNVQVVMCAGAPDPRDAPDGDVRFQRLEDAIVEDQPDLAGWQVFLCGSPGAVRTLKKRAYLGGAALADIHADPFVEATAPATGGP